MPDYYLLHLNDRKTVLRYELDSRDERLYDLTNQFINVQRTAPGTFTACTPKMECTVIKKGLDNLLQAKPGELMQVSHQKAQELLKHISPEQNWSNI